MHPAIFASVMATGILALGAAALGVPAIGVTLTAINVALYSVLVSLTILRLCRYPREFRDDLLSHNRCVGFFTIVAATNVLGSQCLVILKLPLLATTLWFLGLFLWMVSTYGLFAVLTIKQQKPLLETGINGSWLVSVVAAQSVSVLGSGLSMHDGRGELTLMFFSLAMWFGGGMLYVCIIALIFYRYMFFKLQPCDLAPPYWINMGAMAISTLAGASITQAIETSPALHLIYPFSFGLTVLYWSTATWWIPMLVVLGFWRHAIGKLPVRYDPLYWGLVFPLGMYAMCTWRLSQMIPIQLLVGLAWTFFVLGLLAWVLAFSGMLRSQLR
ncbi:MAG: tellurite resistance/C4-dicarboxylate transporter family protein [Planctomycetaceae bacterium]